MGYLPYQLDFWTITSISLPRHNKLLQRKKRQKRCKLKLELMDVPQAEKVTPLGGRPFQTEQRPKYRIWPEPQLSSQDFCNEWYYIVPSNVVWKVFANLPTRDFSFLPLHFGWNSVVESGSWEQTINKHYGRSTGHLKATCSEYEHTCLHLPTFCLHSVWHVSWRWECDLLTSCLAPQKSVVIHEFGTMHHWIRGFKYQLFMWITIGYLKKEPKSCWDFMNSHQNSPVNTIELPRFKSESSAFCWPSGCEGR